MARTNVHVQPARLLAASSPERRAQALAACLALTPALQPHRLHARKGRQSVQAGRLLVALSTRLPQGPCCAALPTTSQPPRRASLPQHHAPAASSTRVARYSLGAALGVKHQGRSTCGAPSNCAGAQQQPLPSHSCWLVPMWPAMIRQDRHYLPSITVELEIDE